MQTPEMKSGRLDRGNVSSSMEDDSFTETNE
jgi:hypothetical protein